MTCIDDGLKNIDNVICDNIELINAKNIDRAIIAQNLLSQSRNLVEHVALKIYSQGTNIFVNWDTIPAALEYIKHDNRYLFLRSFHSFLQESKSHYTPNNDGAERLLLKYYKFFVQIKSFMYKHFKISILNNIDKIPIDTDKTIQEYHDKIAELLIKTKENKGTTHSQRMYVHKVNSFISNQSVFFELTLSPAFDTTSKFERFVCYSKTQIPLHYAIKADFCTNVIYIRNTRMPISILVNHSVSIRPCELKNFARIFGIDLRIKSSDSEYIRLMNYLTTSGISLREIVGLSDDNYEKIKKYIFEYNNSNTLEQIFDRCRSLVLSNLKGANVVGYLLHTMNNKVIKNQLSDTRVYKLSNLYLKWKCIPFDTMPFATSLVRHNPCTSDLLDSLSSVGREHEFMARFILQKMNDRSKLYTPIKDFSCVDDVEQQFDIFNNQLYPGHKGRRIEKFGHFFYQKEAFDNTKFIINKLSEICNSGPKGFGNAIKSWLENISIIDSIEKRNILKNLFINSYVSVIYGAAGTGKTYLVNLISLFLREKDKLFLANTNPAVENLRRKITAQNSTFMTISKFLSSKKNKKDYTVVIVDECSMVSNHDMRKILDSVNCKLLLLVGDTYQIESIEFGNWFSLIKYFLPYHVCNELTTTYRTEEQHLLNLWNKVRNLDSDITEYIIDNNYVSNLDSSIFEKVSDDEIILCLNYDGFYGINNINLYLQENNLNKPFKWGIRVFKVGDPILFNESERFAPILYNNLKGRIVDIEIDNNSGCIWFSIEVDKVLTEFDDVYGLELIDTTPLGKSIVRFKVTQNKDSDVDNDFVDDSDIPFQIAYAVSIHKAQGLEYDSVKIVITKDVDEMITHNIFYTAITRSKKRLKIYMSPESQEKIFNGFELDSNKYEAKIFSAHSKLKLKNIR